MPPWRQEFASCLEQRKVLVTGANGFVGRHLVAALLALGAQVAVTTRTPGEAQTGLREVPADIRVAEDVERVVSSIQPDIVFQLAGVVDTRHDLSLVHATLATNVLGTVNLMVALTGTSCGRIVVTGSSEEITAASGSPDSPYAASKVAATAYVGMFASVYALPTVLVRPFLTYGPGQQPHKLIPYATLELLAHRDPVIRSGARVCDFIYVDDLVRGLLYASIDDHAVGRMVELGTGVGTTINDAVTMIADLIGGTGQPTGDPADSTAREPAHVASLSAGMRPQGWTPSWTLRDGLGRTIDWYRERNKELSHTQDVTS
ncbi:MAG: SDR family NAD(P)-dependent oxidoreductase [Actinobacteria bacterium]|nr:SDR family NAD(P)-dependent oxidoreductase [Actinomycetota bacterium]